MRFAPLLFSIFSLVACSQPLNNPYSQEDKKNTLYTSFEERPKHLDPARAYSANEYEIIGQIYEPPLQYAYLERPSRLEPLAAVTLPHIAYLDQNGQPLPENAPDEKVAYSVYHIHLRTDIAFQPHPAFVKGEGGNYRYHALNQKQLDRIETLADFPETDTRPLTAEDYIYQIKRLAHPAVHSPIAEMMSDHIVGFSDLSQQLTQVLGKDNWIDLRKYPLEGVHLIDSHYFTIRLHKKYPQFMFWLAMPFFSPIPWEADVFYSQPSLIEKNITLDWQPVGTGPYQLIENNPNKRMVLEKNPYYHEEYYPSKGELTDIQNGYLEDAGKKLPFIDRVLFTLEKETIPYWNKFLQGYYDTSGLASDNFDQAIQFSGQGGPELTFEMKEKGIRLLTETLASTMYCGFNMLDPIVGGREESKALLRQAISIAIDQEEFIAIFMNGRGIPAHSPLPPGLFGFITGKEGINHYVYDWENETAKRKDITTAKNLLSQAGYPNGIDSATGKPLTLYLDAAASGPDDKSILNWYRKQFNKIGIQLVLRTTDYNQFQQKMANGNAQIFRWGWNADYPDPENFFFLLYSKNAKVGKGGENAANYHHPEFDLLFEKMSHSPDNPERLAVIKKMQDIIRHDAPWVFGVHPKRFSLVHAWYKNYKPHIMANNILKYLRIDGELRHSKRLEWNQPIFWPILLSSIILGIFIYPAYLMYRRRMQETYEFE